MAAPKVVERKLAELPPEARSLIAYENNSSLDVVLPQPAMARLVEEMPVVRWEGGVAFFRFEEVVLAARNPDIVSRNPYMTETAMGNRVPLIPLQIDGADHKRWRKLLDPLLAPRAVAGLEPEIRRLANELVDGFADKGEVEFHDAFAVPFPCVTFLRLFGLPVEDLDFLNGVKDDILKNGGKDLTERAQRAVVAGDRLRDYLATRLEERAAEPELRDDLIGRIMALQVDGRPVSADELMNIVHLFTIAGLDTVTASLSCIVSWFARHPAERRRVVADPSLLPGAIEELMRFESPVFTANRHAVVDTEVNGIAIRKGEMVTPCWGTADLDPAVFADPLVVDIERPHNRHITFAAGFHRCLGSHLARLELRCAVEEFHRRIPDYEIAPGDAPRYNHQGVRAAEHLPLVFPVTSGG